MMLVRLPNKILLHFFAILFWGAIYIQVGLLNVSVRLIKIFEITAGEPNNFITAWNTFSSIGVAVIIIFAGLTFIRRSKEISPRSWIATIIFSVFSADLLFSIMPNLFANPLWNIASVIIYCLAVAIYCQNKTPETEEADSSEEYYE
ncbi:MAG: hypothetical protein Q4A27_03430 [bacterium]|nr:hypothetical protein [bacterium]